MGYRTENVTSNDMSSVKMPGSLEVIMLSSMIFADMSAER